MGTAEKRRALNTVKKMLRFSHGMSDEVKQIMSEAGLDTPEVRRESEKVHAVCGICVSPGQAADRAKTSLTYVNAAFSDDIQTDFVTVCVRDEKYEVLNIFDMGTRYGERAMAPTRDGRAMMNMVETHWLYQHGAPKNFSADPEFCKAIFRKFLTGHDIKLNVRPSPSLSRNIVVERNNGTVKLFLSKLSI